LTYNIFFCIFQFHIPTFESAKVFLNQELSKGNIFLTNACNYTHFFVSNDKRTY
jgi:hypothetical protein